MTTLLSFIILLGILVTIHELGHFIAARSVGVYVEKFSIGMPPRIFTITSKDNGFLFRLFFYKRREGSLEWQPIYEKLIKKNNKKYYKKLKNFFFFKTNVKKKKCNVKIF